MVPRPANAWPIAPKGFKVELYATGLDNPRLIRIAPNGDLFLAESASGKIKIFRGVGARRQAEAGLRLRRRPAPALRHRLLSQRAESAMGLYRRHRRHRALPLSERRPKGARPGAANSPTCPAAAVCAAAATGPATSSSPKTAQSSSPPSARTPMSTTPTRIPRSFTAPTCSSSRPKANSSKIYASGIRNCVGEAINPTTGELWCSTNERDALGNNLVPDYITHVQEGGFYGWPWCYMGGRQPGPAPPGQASRAAVQSHHARHPAGSPLRLARDDSSTRARSFPPSTRATASPPSTAPGIAPSAPAMKSSACP